MSRPNEQVRRDELYGRDELVEQATGGVDHAAEAAAARGGAEGRAFGAPELPAVPTGGRRRRTSETEAPPAPPAGEPPFSPSEPAGE